MPAITDRGTVIKPTATTRATIIAIPRRGLVVVLLFRPSVETTLHYFYRRGGLKQKFIIQFLFICSL